MTDKKLAQLLITVLGQIEQIQTFADLVPIIRTAATTAKEALLADASFTAVLNKDGADNA